MPGATKRRFELPVELEMERIVSLQVASELSGMSIDTWKRRHAALIRRISPRRVGVRLRDVLNVGQQPAA